jgi:hypothetical protein
MKWNKGSKEGIPISIGDHQANDFNHRVQRFSLQQND